MEDKILGALNDIAKAIEEIASYTKKKIDNTTNSLLQTVDLGKKMEDIKDGIKSIKKDTEKILKNQETLSRISKDKNSKNSLFNSVGEKAGKIKQGVSTVLLIAAGVLAIGVAFKLIGQVNFTSVIALSIALPLVAIAFERIAELKGLKGADMKNILLSVISMSTAIMISSWLLSAIKPISIGQGLTAILIAGTFAIMSINIDRIAKGVRNITPNDMIKMPLVLFTMSLAITLSSQILRGIHPISIGQGLTAILIAGTFAVLGYSIEKISKGIKNVTPADMIKMPLVLIAMAFSITVASQIMRLISPISFAQALTAIAISATLAIMSLSLPALAYAAKLTSVKDVFLMTAILPLMALAIMLSSYPLSATADIPAGKLLSITLQAIALGVMGVVLGGSAYVLSKICLQSILEGSIALIALAGVMMTSSLILSLGKYDKYPTLEWAAGVGLSLVAFGLSAIVLGTIAASGVGALALLAGAAAILGLAGVVVATSYILGAGSYKNYPDLNWSSGVALSLAAFGVGTMMLGTFILGSLGLGMAALMAGSVGVDVIAKSIVSASNILGTGTYTGGPTKEWAEGISLALGAFSPVFETLFNRGIMGIFTKGPSSKDFADAITNISNGIVTAGMFFSKVPNIWSGGPTEEWATGVGGAIGAFTPVFDALSKSSGLFGSGPSPKDMSNAILEIANSIVQVGNYFNGAAGVWKNAPTPEWAAGVSGAIGAFAPIFDYLNQNKNNGWFDNSIKDLNNAILMIAHSIIDVDSILSKGSFNSTIPAGYIQSMSENIKAYVDLIDYLQSKNIGALSFLNTLSVSYGLSQIANGYDKLSKSVKSLSNSLNTLDMDKLNSLKNLTGSIVLMSLMDSDQFEKMMDALENKAGIFVKIMQDLEGSSNAKEKSFGTLNSVKGNKSTGATTDDVLNTLLSIDGKMGKMITYSKSCVDIMEEIRNNNNNNSLKSKKHYG